MVVWQDVVGLGVGGHKLYFPSWGDDSKICHPSSVMTNVRERQLLFWGRRGVRCGQNKGEILTPFLRMVASNPTTRMLLHDSWTCLEAILCVEERVIWAFSLGRHERRGKEKNLWFLSFSPKGWWWFIILLLFGCWNFNSYPLVVLIFLCLFGCIQSIIMEGWWQLVLGIVCHWP
jgi:hypothetical protein